MTRTELLEELDQLRLQRDHFREAIKKANTSLTNHRHRMALLARSNKGLKEQIGRMKQREDALNARITELEKQLRIQMN